MKVFITDCEGPITKNDNAMELCTHFIPQGDQFFAVLSRYDDYLAYVEARPGYKAGDTLKLILPFLLAFGCSEDEMLPFSLKNMLTMPRALEALRRIGALMPTFIVSTSYEPYIRALCGLIPFPVENTFSTAVALRGLRVPEGEERRLRELAREIASMPLIEWGEARGPEELTLEAKRLVERLDEIFWGELAAGVAGEVLRSVEPVGGEAKAEAVRRIAQKVGVVLEEVMYVGDSITDREALGLVREAGGVAISFNGNRYALEVAEVACLAEDAAPLVAFALLFLRGGKEEVLRGVLNWRAEYLLARGVPEEWVPRAEVGLVTEENLPLWISKSEGFRRQVRGVKVGGLG